MQIDARGRGFVRGNDTTLTVTPALDTGAYTAADVLFPMTSVANAVLLAGDSLTLMSVNIIDKDAMGLPIDLHFFSGSVASFGTANGTVALTDADALSHLGRVSIGTADYSALGGAQVATIPLVGLELTPTTTSLWMAGVTGGTPTHTAAGLQINLGVIR
jgi:hypothetical protein